MEKKAKSEKETYQTPHFYLSVWFVMNEKKLLGIDRSNPKRLVFIFEKDDDIKKLFNEFWQNEFIQKFISYIQELKVEMYASNPPMVFKSIKNEDPATPPDQPSE